MPSRRFVVRLSILLAPFALLTVSPAHADVCDPPPSRPGTESAQVETAGDARRETDHAPAQASPEGESAADAESSAPDQPAIGFIDSPTSVCYQPDPAQNVCYINWYYLSVSASPNYMICMSITLNAIGKVARYTGFFQTSMYVPYNMHDKGFKVACGTAGAGGDPSLGNAYAWTIRAIDSSNLKSANYGTVYCPAYQP